KGINPSIAIRGNKNVRSRFNTQIIGITLPYNSPFTLADKLSERLFIILARWVNFMVVIAYSANKAQIRMKGQKIAIELIALIYKVFAIFLVLAHVAVWHFGAKRIADKQP